MRRVGAPSGGLGRTMTPSPFFRRAPFRGVHRLGAVGFGGNSKALRIPKIIRLLDDLILLLNAGLSIDQVFAYHKTGVHDEELASVYEGLHAEMQQGRGLKDAFDAQADRFPDFFMLVIGLGEETGDIDGALRLLKEYYENLSRNQKYLAKQIRYPLILIGSTFFMTLALLILVVPTFAQMYVLLEDDLPLISRALLFASDALRHSTAGLVILSAVLLLAARFPYGKKKWRRRFRFGWLTNYRKRRDLITFCHAMSVLSQKGMSLLNALEVASRVLSAEHQIHVERLADDIRQGTALRVALAGNEWFPEIMTILLVSAEEAGQLELGFSRIQAYLSARQQERIDRVLGSLNPLLLLMAGLIIAAMMIGIYLPLFNLAGLE